jgi:carboxylesterase
MAFASAEPSPAPPAAAQLRPYSSPEHASFLWAGGAAVAILIHGFPGTPAEMRPIGKLLHAQGWTVESNLLPGFGPEIAQIADYRWEDWVAAVHATTARYVAQGRTLLLVGNSTGAAVAMAVAAQQQVAGLVLIAPFWRAHLRILDQLFPVLQPLLDRLRPFAQIDFTDEAATKPLVNVLGPEADLTDPATQTFIRNLPLPVTALAQVRRAGHHAYRVAPNILVPALVLQGTHDPVAHPRETHTLVRRLPKLTGYLEFNADHDLVQKYNNNGLTNGVEGNDLYIAQPIHRFTQQILNDPHHAHP